VYRLDGSCLQPINSRERTIMKRIIFNMENFYIFSYFLCSSIIALYLLLDQNYKDFLLYSTYLGHLIAYQRISTEATIDDTIIIIKKAGSSCPVARRITN
jgi:hypothetical protein